MDEKYYKTIQLDIAEERYKVSNYYLLKSTYVMF